jgi:uncharacterized membrane protein YfcA
MFGIGGGVLTTPAIRLLLGYPELVAVGTPLPVIIPGALAAAVSYVREGIADLRTGLKLGAWGAVASVGGAALTRVAGGDIVLILTAVLIVYISGVMLVGRDEAPVAGGSPGTPAETIAARPWWHLALAGMLGGAYSGFLGLGGGFVMVPLLYRVFKVPLKYAIGTSLVAVTAFAVPGTITHWYLGNVDPRLALVLAAGVVPGALLGARIAFAAEDRHLRVAFAIMLGAVGVLLGVTEISGRS